MHSQFRRLLALAIAVAALAGSGAAFAAGRTGTPGHHTNGDLVAAVASYLGLTPKQVLVDLAQGQSLAQIATTHGKTVAGLEQAIEAAVKTDLDQAVAAGKLTAGQEQFILAALPAKLDQIVNAKRPSLARGQAPGGVIQAAATYLGMTAQQLVTQLKSGQSLAQIAVAHGKTAAGLEQVLVAGIKTQLDAAVAAGMLTSAQEQAILAKVTAGIVKLVEHTQ